MVDRKEVLAGTLKETTKWYRQEFAKWHKSRWSPPFHNHWKYPREKKNSSKFLIMVSSIQCEKQCYPLPKFWGSRWSSSMKSSNRIHRRQRPPQPLQVLFVSRSGTPPIFQRLCKGTVLPQLFLSMACLLMPFIKAFKALEKSCQKTINLCQAAK